MCTSFIIFPRYLEKSQTSPIQPKLPDLGYLGFLLKFLGGSPVLPVVAATAATHRDLFADGHGVRRGEDAQVSGAQVQLAHAGPDLETHHAWRGRRARPAVLGSLVNGWETPCLGYVQWGSIGVRTRIL